MSAHDSQYIREFQHNLPEQGSMVTISFEFLGSAATIIALEKVCRELKRENLPERLDARPISGLPCVRIDVLNKQQPEAHHDEHGRLEIIEGGCTNGITK